MFTTPYFESWFGSIDVTFFPFLIYGFYTSVYGEKAEKGLKGGKETKRMGNKQQQ